MRAGVLVFVLIAILVSAPAFGQTLSPKKEYDDWNFYIAPYFYLINMSGSAATTSPYDECMEFPVDLATERIAENWDYGFAGLIHLKKARWAFGLDLSFAKFSHDQCMIIPDYMECEADVKNTLTIGEHELFVGYQFNESMPASDVIVGLRYVNHDIEIEPADGPDELAMTFGETFYVPFIGIRYYGLLSEDSKWSPFIRGDIGTATSDLKFNWRVNFGIAWLFADHFDLNLQYKWKHDNYLEGNIGEDDYYRYEATEHGPMLGLGIRF